MGSESTLIVIIILISVGVFYYGKKAKDRQNELRAYKKMLAGVANHVAVFERERIARDLHDEIGTKLGVLQLNLVRISRNPENAELRQLLIRENLDVINSAIENTRRISKDLMLPGFTSSGYKKALEELCREVTVSGQVNLELTAFPENLEIAEFAMLQIFRIVQEAANNIIRHASATHIRISVVSEEKCVKTVLAHNGIPFSREKERKVMLKGEGSGLKNMQSRAELINASINYDDSENESQTIISIAL